MTLDAMVAFWWSVNGTSLLDAQQEMESRLLSVRQGYSASVVLRLKATSIECVLWCQRVSIAIGCLIAG